MARPPLDLLHERFRAVRIERVLRLPIARGHVTVTVQQQPLEGGDLGAHGIGPELCLGRPLFGG